MSDDIKTKSTRMLLFMARNIARSFDGATAEERYRYAMNEVMIDAEAERRDGEMIRLLTRIAELEAREAEAATVIARGVELMTTDQVGQWDGVRAWQEMEP